MNISLPVELEKLVNDKVRSGLYTSASEVVREGLVGVREDFAHLLAERGGGSRPAQLLEITQKCSLRLGVGVQQQMNPGPRLAILCRVHLIDLLQPLEPSEVRFVDPARQTTPQEIDMVGVDALLLGGQLEILG